MVSLALAMLCQFGLFRRFSGPDPGPALAAVRLMVAGLSLTLWFAVGWAGRMIAFVLKKVLSGPTSKESSR